MKRLTVYLRAFVLMVALAASPSLAVEPDEVLDDPVLEQRARAISAELRCMVCQNQSIDDSNAELARDLRVIVRERLVAGDSDADVYDYVVSRYGEFVLLRPRVTLKTLMLWAAPVLVMGAGIAAVAVFLRNRDEAVAGRPLSAEEQAELDRILRQRRG
ncbi:cytochrome c-type biogenesis protein [Pararhizobium haloflavum]|uniref:cytochrome c-type biogenesis protein n=1 Tax=Pararhizobium haloflavum TaxID=2037914 RepID=UPI000C1839DB|nr:cytochrome c-type biogenesis protein [Pararhizobium haloflavum]